MCLCLLFTFFIVVILIFFGTIAACLVMLLCMNLLAKKYLNGDFKTVNVEEVDEPLLNHEEGEEELEEVVKVKSLNENEVTQVKHEGLTETLLKQAEAFKQYSDSGALSIISETAFSESFAANASVHLSLQFIEATNCLLGNILKIESLYLLETSCPHEINFHIKIIPKSRFKIKTKWKPVSSKILALSFTMGPIEKKELPEFKLCIRLYGKKRGAFSRAKVYGECFVALNELTKHSKPLEFMKRILPKAKDTIKHNTIT